jgi:hypothetical protein
VAVAVVQPHYFIVVAMTGSPSPWTMNVVGLKRGQVADQRRGDAGLCPAVLLMALGGWVVALRIGDRRSTAPSLTPRPATVKDVIFWSTIALRSAASKRPPTMGEEIEDARRDRAARDPRRRRGDHRALHRRDVRVLLTMPKDRSPGCRASCRRFRR